ncbi:RHS repeat-associated core domain-containing protein, partial [Chitinophaga sp. 30R24]|uniref:RHS repeat-associated core domain-containing protein n=1 Tax=Chitinophaga sp. 30R24 TaxID=3248838 RepID=UPI003B8F9061
SGADTIYVDVSGGSHVMRSTGTLAVSNPVTNLMGKVTVEVILSNRTGNQGTFRIDNFTLNGYVAPIDSSVYNSVPGRYRYGFNGKENDNEVKGEGNQQDYGMRIYDPRVGKFLGVDPMGSERVSWTPYNAMRNNPVNNIDPTGGLDEWVETKDGQTLWDDKVTDQKSATQRYGEGATYRGPGYSYTSKSGESVTLGSNRSFTVNGTSKTAVNSTNPYDPGTFTYWNYANGKNYDSQVEAYRAWQSFSGYHPGEGRWDKIFRGTAFASMEARREYASGGMNMFGGHGKATTATTTIYRSVSEAEATSFTTTGRLSFGQGTLEAKQFWLTEAGLNNFNKTGFGNGFNLVLKVPTSLIGEGEAINTMVQVDEFLGPSGTIESMEALQQVNKAIKSYHIIPFVQ